MPPGLGNGRYLAWKDLFFAIDIQELYNPASNKDRRPVFIAGRTHFEF
jgi:hypothetical protein